MPEISLEVALYRVGPGWHKLINQVYKEKEKYPLITIVDCKEKFGGLRVYFNSIDDTKKFNVEDEKFANFVEEIEELSQRTCEVCGKDGKVVQINWLLACRCSNHNKAMNKPKLDKSKEKFKPKKKR